MKPCSSRESGAVWMAVLLTVSFVLACAGGSAAQSGSPSPQREADAELLKDETSEAPPDTSWLDELSPDALFLRASSSALQFQSMIEPARKRLVREHEISLPYLVTRLDTDDARERHALEDILVRIGEPAVEPVIEAFRSEVMRDLGKGAWSAE